MRRDQSVAESLASPIQWHGFLQIRKKTTVSKSIKYIRKEKGKQRKSFTCCRFELQILSGKFSELLL
jgi:hypothetical protein